MGVVAVVWCVCMEVGVGGGCASWPTHLAPPSTHATDPERLELGAGLAALHPEELDGISGVAEYRNLAAIGTARYPERDGI